MDWDARLAAAEKDVEDTMRRMFAALTGPTVDIRESGGSPVDTFGSALAVHRDALTALERLAQEWNAAGCPPRRLAPAISS